MDVIVVCHTEFGFVSDKKTIYNRKHKGGVAVGVPNLIKLADKYGAKITFAIMPETVEYFPQNISHKIGLHIHPNWDEFLKKNCKQSSNSTVLWDYSYDEQLGMIKAGKELLKNKFGSDPKVFLAGRWCLNNDTIKVLEESGFTHDCSATPGSKNDHLNWSELFRVCMPYHPSESNYQRKGKSPVLEVPVSQFFPSGSVNVEMIPRYSLPWLEACFKEYYHQKAPLFHICLHSPSMTDSYFISAMDKLIGFIANYKDINFKFASEIKEYPNKKYKTNIIPYIFAADKDIVRSGIKRFIRI